MWNEKKFKEVYAYWQSCGLSIPAFCSNEGISESRFYYWKNKLQHSLPSESTGEFIPITIDHPKELPSHLSVRHTLSDSIAAGVQDFFCEITYPNGTRLKFNEQPGIEFLQSLLLLLR